MLLDVIFSLTVSLLVKNVISHPDDINVIYCENEEQERSPERTSQIRLKERTVLGIEGRPASLTSPGGENLRDNFAQ